MYVYDQYMQIPFVFGRCPPGYAELPANVPAVAPKEKPRIGEPFSNLIWTLYQNTGKNPWFSHLDGCCGCSFQTIDVYI
jgi:hypothetical protein